MSESQPLRVTVVASAPALRAGVRALLAAPDIHVGDPSIGPETQVFVLANEDDLAAMASQLREDHTQAVVVMGNSVHTVNVLRAWAVRGWGMVLPDATADELLSAVRAVAQGLVVLPPRLAQSVMGAVAPSTEAEMLALEQPLTPREIEVLDRVSRGLPSKHIARELDVSESTIKFHLSSIYSKLGVSSRTEAVSRAARLGLITL